MTVVPTNEPGEHRTGEPAAPATTPEGSETPEQLRERIANLERFKADALNERSNSEENRRERERLARENEQLQASLSALTTQGVQPRDLTTMLMQAHGQYVERANAGDPEAALIVAQQEQLRHLTQKLEDVDQRLRTPEAEREEVSKIRSEYRQRGETISAATARELLELRRAKAQPQPVVTREPEPPPTNIQRVPAKPAEGAFPTTSV